MMGHGPSNCPSFCSIFYIFQKLILF
jgi:hypothetical protein